VVSQDVSRGGGRMSGVQTESPKNDSAVAYALQIEMDNYADRWKKLEDRSWSCLPLCVRNANTVVVFED